MATLDSREHATSAITVGELVYGAHRSPQRDRFLALIEQLVPPALPFDEAAARVYGRIRSELERTGQRVAEPDLRIAAIALSRELTLVTGNVRHFSRVPGLRVENWLVA